MTDEPEPLADVVGDLDPKAAAALAAVRARIKAFTEAAWARLREPAYCLSCGAHLHYAGAACKHCGDWGDHVPSGRPGED